MPEIRVAIVEWGASQRAKNNESSRKRKREIRKVRVNNQDFA